MNEQGKSEDIDLKPKNVLAIFKHVTQKGESPRKFNFNRRLTASPASDDLVIDDQYNETEEDAPKKRIQGVRMMEEPLLLKCKWNSCFQIFKSYKMFIEHIQKHVLNASDSIDEQTCLWLDCSYKPPTILALTKHVCYHGYHTKLMNIGQNVLSRINLPDCTSTMRFQIPEPLNDFVCEWEDCYEKFLTVYEMYIHIQYHVACQPKHCKKGEFIWCLWKGCIYKFSTSYKLSDHLRSHTKEKLVACPTCGNCFATKTKFSDHRKRHLPIDMQSYQCSQCSKLFPSERLLRDHMRSHINHYKCGMCDMTCPKPSNLAKHIKFRHLNDRPYKCHLCDHASVEKWNLEEHLISHCAEKLMACEVCDFRCRSLYGLDCHYQKVHGEAWAQRYECHICKKIYHRGNLLTNHLIKVHDFNWPSGHSRFRYKEDTDGIYRLQTVRYESLEVTEEMISTSNDDKENSKTSEKKEESGEVETNNDKKTSYVLMISEEGEENVVQTTDNNILITIDDVDETGNVIKSETVHSNEIICATEPVRRLRPRKNTQNAK